MVHVRARTNSHYTYIYTYTYIYIRRTCLDMDPHPPLALRLRHDVSCIQHVFDPAADGGPYADAHPTPEPVVDNGDVLCRLRERHVCVVWKCEVV